MLQEYSENSKYLIVTRGLPGSGKSSYIANTFGHDFTIISPDEIRMQLYGLNEEGRISQGDPNTVWNTVYGRLFRSLSLEESVVIDSTACSKRLIKRGLHLATEHGYEFIVLDFTSVNIDTCLERNKARNYYQFVPEEVIYDMEKRLSAQDLTNFKDYIVDYKDFDIRKLK